MSSLRLLAAGLALALLAVACSPGAVASPEPLSTGPRWVPAATGTSPSATTSVDPAGATTRPSPGTPPPSCAPDTSLSPPTADNLVAAIPLGCEAGAVAVGGDSVWVVPHLERVMLRVDPGTNAVVERIPLGDGGPGAEIAANNDMVWASVSSTSFDLERLVRVDPDSGELVATVEVEAGSPVLTRDWVWATGPDGVHRIDPASNALLGSLDARECGVIADGVRAWCINEQSATELRGEGLRPIILVEAARLGWPVAWAGNRIWGISAEGLWTLDPRTGAVTEPIGPPASVGTWSPDAVVLDGVLWVAASTGGADPFRSGPDRLVRVDPADGRVGCILEIPNPEHGIGAGHGAIWVPVVRQPWLLRIEPDC